LKLSGKFLVLLLFFTILKINSQWQPSSAGMINTTVSAFAVNGSDIFAGTHGKGIFISNNNGVDWYPSSLTSGTIYSLFIHGGRIFAGSHAGYFTSENNGVSWNLTTYPGESFRVFAIKGNKIFAGTNKNALNGNLYSSTDNGTTWSLTSLTGSNIYSISVTSSRIYASTYGGLFYSEDDGLTWNILNFNHGAPRIVAADDSGVIILTTGIGATRSTDHGTSWNHMAALPEGNDYNCILFSGNNVYIGSNNDYGILYSANKGQTWTRILTGKWVNALALNENTLYTGGDHTGILRSTNNGSTWEHPRLYIQDVHALISSGQTLVAGINSAVSFSSNSGAVWNFTSFNAQMPAVFSLASNGNGHVYAGTDSYGIVTSQNNGASFEYNHPFIGGAVYALCAFDNFVFGGSPAGVYISNNNGTSFTPTALNNRVVRALTRKDNTILAGTENNGIYYSTNNGIAWIQSNLNNATVRSFTLNGGSIFAGTLGQGVYVSGDNGATWSQTTLNDKDILSLASNGNNIYAGSTRAANFFVSTNSGTTWVQRNEGIVNADISSLHIFNGFIYAGTMSSGVFKRSLNELTGIQQISNETPNKFSLSQNYPNPFNPATTIRFNIPANSSVAQTFLSVYDMLGKEVATLVNQQLTPGTYSVNWDASNHPSGVYFYRLSSGNFAQTNKMILLK